MAEAKFEQQIKAVEMRREGRSLNDISQTLGVSKSSVSLWTRKITLVSEQKSKLMKRENYKKATVVMQKNWEQRREIYREQGRKKAKENRPLHIAGCMLYWAEGTKKRNTCVFSNSDPNMIVMFMKFLTEELSVQLSDVKVECIFHTSETDKSPQEMVEFWKKLLGIERGFTRKNGDTRAPAKRKKNRHENGMCVLAVFNFKVVQHIYGALENYAGVKLGL